MCSANNEWSKSDAEDSFTDFKDSVVLESQVSDSS